MEYSDHLQELVISEYEKLCKQHIQKIEELSWYGRLTELAILNGYLHAIYKSSSDGHPVSIKIGWFENGNLADLLKRIDL